MWKCAPQPLEKSADFVEDFSQFFCILMFHARYLKKEYLEAVGFC